MKGYLRDKNIPKTEDFLNKQGWEIDRWDGVVSLKNEDYNVEYEGGITIGYRKVVASFHVEKEKVLFYFDTAKNSRYLKDKHLKTTPPEK